MKNMKLERWLSASSATGSVEPFMTVIIQGLGQLDISLAQGDASVRSDANDLASAQRLSKRITLSYLWVLGAYELVRTVCQSLRQNRSLMPVEVSEQFHELKSEFNRLRVPLAKMEPASSHPMDYRIALPAIHRDKGIAWQVGGADFIVRQDLADKLLSTLELMAASAATRGQQPV